MIQNPNAAFADLPTYQMGGRYFSTYPGIRLTPIRRGKKAPLLPRWTEQPAQTMDDWLRLAEPDSGIGIMTGAGFLCVDFDHPRARDLALEDPRFPMSTRSTGRPSRPDSHWWYRIPLGPAPSVAYTLRVANPTTGEKKEIGILDLSGDLRQVVEYPSIHPSGETYTESWETMATTDYATILAACQAVAERFGQWWLGENPGWALAGDLATATEPPRPRPQAALTIPFDEIRPGDLYNESDAYADLLRGRGWVLLRTHADQEFWRRPGKTGPEHSAIFHRDKRLFHVFSSAADLPVGDHKPLGIFAHYRTGGDFAEAGRLLRTEGFAPSPTPAPALPEVVNGWFHVHQTIANAMENKISEFFSAPADPIQPAPQSLVETVPPQIHPSQIPIVAKDDSTPADFADDGPEVETRTDHGMDHEWLRPPGLIGLVVDYYQQTALFPSPMSALATGLAVMAGIVGNRVAVRLPAPIGNSLYVLSVAPSGSGKDHGRGCIQRIFAAILRPHIVGGEMGFGSHYGIFDELRDAPRQTKIFLVDEIGALFSGSGPHHSQSLGKRIIDALNTIYSGQFGQVAPPLTKRRGKPPEPIRRPCAIVYGTTTPTDFFGHLTPSHLEGGLIGRSLIFLDDYRPLRESDAPINWTVPESIIQHAGRWDAVNAAVMDPNETPTDPTWLPTDPEALAASRDLARDVNRLVLAPDAAHDPTRQALMIRSPQRANTIAALLAYSEIGPGDELAPIRSDHVEAGYRIDRALLETFLGRLGRDWSTGNRDADLNRKIFFAVPLQDDGPILHHRLMDRLARVGSRDKITAALGLLVDAGKVFRETRLGPNGKAAKIYYRTRSSF